MNRHNLQLIRHAASEYEGWVKIVIQFRLSQKPGGWPQLRVEGDSIINNSFTFRCLQHILFH